MKVKNIIIAIILYIFMSLSSVLMKFASLQSILFNKVLLYFSSIAVLGIFAILWQKLLKGNNLSTVYAFKSTTIIWGMIFGVIFFNENISIQMIIGSIVTAIGVAIIIKDGSNE